MKRYIFIKIGRQRKRYLKEQIDLIKRQVEKSKNIKESDINIYMYIYIDRQIDRKIFFLNTTCLGH